MSLDSPTFSNSSFESEANSVVNRVLTTVSASLSILGTSLIIITFIAWKDLRSTSRKILVFISIGDFFIAGGNLWGVWLARNDHTTIPCKAQSFVTTCASLWSFFWTTFLSIFMYTAVARRQAEKADKMLRYFHIFGWGIPLIITGIAFGENKLGNDYDFYSAGWCWISGNLTTREKQIWMLLTGKAWEMAAYVLISTFFWGLKYHIRKEVYHRKKQFTSLQNKESAIKAERRLTMLPIIFILVRIWGTIRFIIYLSDNHIPAAALKSDREKALLYLQGIGDSSQGLANFLLFCLFTEKFRGRLKLAAKECLQCCKSPSGDPPPRMDRSGEFQNDHRTLINESSNLLASTSTSVEQGP